MDDLKFKRDDLLDIIQKNRDEHRKEFEEAIAGYQQDAIDRLQGLVDALKAGKRPNITVSMPIPQDHTKDYDRIIKMLTMSQETIVVVDEADFGQYVQDDWSWKGQFLATNAMYKKLHD